MKFRSSSSHRSAFVIGLSCLMGLMAATKAIACVDVDQKAEFINGDLVISVSLWGGNGREYIKIRDGRSYGDKWTVCDEGYVKKPTGETVGQRYKCELGGPDDL